MAAGGDPLADGAALFAGQADGGVALDDERAQRLEPLGRVGQVPRREPGDAERDRQPLERQLDRGDRACDRRRIGQDPDQRPERAPGGAELDRLLGDELAGDAEPDRGGNARRAARIPIGRDPEDGLPGRASGERKVFGVAGDGVLDRRCLG